MNEIRDPESPGGEPAGAAATRSRRRFLALKGGFAACGAGTSSYSACKFLSPRTPRDPFRKDARAVLQKVTPADASKPGMGKNGGYAGRGVLWNGRRTHRSDRVPGGAAGPGTGSLLQPYFTLNSVPTRLQWGMLAILGASLAASLALAVVLLCRVLPSFATAADRPAPFEKP